MQLETAAESTDVLTLAEALAAKLQREVDAAANTPLLSPEEQRAAIIAADAAHHIQAMQGNMM